MLTAFGPPSQIGRAIEMAKQKVLESQRWPSTDDVDTPGTYFDFFPAPQQRGRAKAYAVLGAMGCQATAPAGASGCNGTTAAGTIGTTVAGTIGTTAAAGTAGVKWVGAAKPVATISTDAECNSDGTVSKLGSAEHVGHATNANCPAAIRCSCTRDGSDAIRCSCTRVAAASHTARAGKSAAKSHAKTGTEKVALDTGTENSTTLSR